MREREGGGEGEEKYKALVKNNIFNYFYFSYAMTV